jgi:hypothetical protein
MKLRPNLYFVIYERSIFGKGREDMHYTNMQVDLLWTLFLPRPVLWGKNMSCDWSMRISLVIFMVLPSVRIYWGQAGARFYSTSVQRVMYTLFVQHFNWAKQSVCISNKKIAIQTFVSQKGLVLQHRWDENLTKRSIWPWHPDSTWG